MIKALFTALTGIAESIDSPEAQEAWEKQKYLDDEDLDDFDSAATDNNEDSDREGENFAGWFGLW